MVNATLEASENFTSQWSEEKTILCSFTEIKGRFGLNILCQMHSQIVIIDH